MGTYIHGEAISWAQVYAARLSVAVCGMVWKRRGELKVGCVKLGLQAARASELRVGFWREAMGVDGENSGRSSSICTSRLDWYGFDWAYLIRGAA